jgi:hypothetical protein
MIHENNERLHYKGLEGPQACPVIRANLLHRCIGLGSFTSQEEGERLCPQNGPLRGARVLGCVNKLLQFGVGHVNKAFTDALKVETDVVRGHHC